MSMLVVDGVPVRDPSSFQWGLNDISDSDSGRTSDTLMHKNRIGQKRKIQLKWPLCTQTEIHSLLVAFNPEYINVEYYDPLDGDTVTREFYVGDRSAPVKMWTDGKKWYQELSFDIIER